MASTFTQVLVFVCGLIMGTGSTVTIKVVYDTKSVDSLNNTRVFEKPLTTTWTMFIAMSLALPFYFLMRWFESCRASSEDSYKESERLLAGGESNDLDIIQEEEEEEVPGFSQRLFWLLSIPAAFDLVGTALGKMGLMYMTVSLYQLIRCTVIIVVALFKVFVLRQPLKGYMWAGVIINMVAMMVISSTSFIHPAGTEGGADKDPRIGIFFVVMSCIVQGAQYVFEEKVMEADGAHPLVVVGMEGFWGTIIMFFVIFPWAYILPGSDVGGCFENLWDSWIMIQNSTAVQLILLGFFVTVAMYNIFAILVTHVLDSVWHAILDNFRPISVWGTDLFIFYVIAAPGYGEAWTSLSYIQLAGMFVLFFGTAVYNGSLRLPCLDYTDIDEDFNSGDSHYQFQALAGEEAGAMPGTGGSIAEMVRSPGGTLRPAASFAAASFASPSLVRSPLIAKAEAGIALKKEQREIRRRLSPGVASDFGSAMRAQNGGNVTGYGSSNGRSNRASSGYH